MTFLYYLAAGLCEIAGCFSFWVWLRLGRSALWVAPGVVSLILFAALLTRVEAALAGRAFAVVRRRLHRLGAVLAVGRRRPFPGYMGFRGRGGLSRRRRGDPVRATLIFISLALPSLVASLDRGR